jgi:Kae1-associated kinase Bud32
MDKKIIQRGAEAVLYLDEIDGQTVLVKERIKKSYRIKQIDEKLRKERTKHESKLLTDARSIGMATPQILKVDNKSHKIIMQFIQGERIKEFLMHADRKDIESVCQSIGESIAKLHNSNIIHGDLTTSNIIKGDKLYFIDFGLGFYSKRIEDKGVDLKLLHDAIKAAHYNILKLCWRNILIGYRKEYKDAEKVINKIEEIEGRARYAVRNKETQPKGK